MGCFLLKIHTKLSFVSCPGRISVKSGQRPLLVLRTVRVSYTHAIVRITHGHEKTGTKTGRFLPYQAIYAAVQNSQPPDSRTYSVEVTSLPSNLLHHRRLRPYRRSDIIQQHHRVCQAFFEIFFVIFHEFRGVIFVHHILGQKGRAGRKITARPRQNAYII